MRLSVAVGEVFAFYFELLFSHTYYYYNQSDLFYLNSAGWRSMEMNKHNLEE